MRIQESQEYLKSSQSVNTREPRGAVFWGLVVLSQILAAICVVLVLVRYHFYSSTGIVWNSSGSFNLHPPLMVLSLVALYGDAILVYRVFRYETKLYIKALHGLIHIVAMIIAGIGFAAIVNQKFLRTAYHFTSLHGLFGLCTIALFIIQWLVGFCSFLLPLCPDNIKAKIITVHTSLGVSLFALAISVCFMGIFSDINNVASTANMMKALGFMMALFGGVVMYLILNIHYKRPPEHHS